MARPIDHARRADQEAMVLAARVKLEADGKRPTALAISRMLMWSTSLTESVVARLVACDNWPESPIPPARPGPPRGAADPGAAGKARAKGTAAAGAKAVEVAAAEISEQWSEDERRRRARDAGSQGRRVEIRECKVSLQRKGR